MKINDKDLLSNLNKIAKPLYSTSIIDASSFGRKAAYLGELINNGVNVPEGICLDKSVYSFFKSQGVLPDSLINDIKEYGYNNTQMAVRSSATCEDSEEETLAGLFNTYYAYSSQDILNSIQKIYEGANSIETLESLSVYGIDDSKVELGVIIQNLIEPSISGVIYNKWLNNISLVQYVEGFGNKLVDGESNGYSIILDSNGKIQDSSGFDILSIEERIIKQINEQVRKIRKIDSFKEKDIDIEFAVSKTNNVLYILQCRVVNNLPPSFDIEESDEGVINLIKRKVAILSQNEKATIGIKSPIFSKSNHSELLPSSKEMDVGIFQYIFSGYESNPGAIQIGRKEMGYILDERANGLTYFIGGDAYISIAKDSLSYYIGFPDSIDSYIEQLVNNYLKQISDNHELGHYPQMGLYLQEPTMHELEGLFNDKASEYYETTQEFNLHLGKIAKVFEDDYNNKYKSQLDLFLDSVTVKINKEDDSEKLVSLIDQVLNNLKNHSCVYFVIAARLGFYFTQKLRKSLQHSGMDQNSIDNYFSLFVQGLDNSEFTRSNLIIAASANIAEASSLALKVIGHYSTGEMLEIHPPRISESSNELKSYVESIYYSNYIETFNKQVKDREVAELEIVNKVDDLGLTEIIKYTQKYMGLRETIKYNFVKEYGIIRQCLVKLEKNFNLSQGDIFYLYPWEVSTLLQNQSEVTHIIKYRKRLHDKLKKVNMPFIIDADNLDKIKFNFSVANEQSGHTGVLVSKGENIEGEIVNKKDFNNNSEISDHIKELKSQGINVILTSNQLSIGDDPLIVSSDAILLGKSGFVSHGSQRARELGKGALSGLPIELFTTGCYVSIDFKSKIARILK